MDVHHLKHVSIPKRVSVVLRHKRLIPSLSLLSLVSIPKRVSVVLRLEMERMDRLNSMFQSLKGFQ